MKIELNCLIVINGQINPYILQTLIKPVYSEYRREIMVKYRREKGIDIKPENILIISSIKINDMVLNLEMMYRKIREKSDDYDIKIHSINHTPDINGTYVFRIVIDKSENENKLKNELKKLVFVSDIKCLIKSA